MQGTFVNNFLASLQGKGFQTSQSLGYGNALSLLSQGAVKLKTILSSRINAYDNLLMAFLQDSDLASDAWAETAEFSESTYADFQSVIAPSVATSLISAIQEFISMNVDPSASSIDDNSLILVDEDGYQYIMKTCDTVFDNVRVLISNTSGEITDMRNAVLYVNEDGEYVFNNVLFSQYFPFTDDPDDPGSGYKCRVNSLWDVVDSLVQTNEINQVFRTSLGITSSVKGAADMMVSLSDALKSKYSSVRSTARRLIDAFNTGGFAGVISCVASTLDKGCSVTNADGTLVFTDNNALVPKQYIASAVTSILTGVANVANLILLAISKPLGLALSVIASVGQGIINSIRFNYEQTNAALFDSVDACMAIAPYGIMQIDFLSEDLPADMIEYLNTEAAVAAIDVPGGTVFIGVGSFNDDGTPLTYRMEFHPSIEPHIRALKAIVDEFHIYNYINTFIVGTQVPGRNRFQWNITDVPAMSVARFVEIYNNTIDSNIQIIRNESNGYLSESNSCTVLNRVVANLAIFFFFYCAVTRTVPEHYRPSVNYSDDVWYVTGTLTGAVQSPWSIMAYGAALSRTLVWGDTSITVGSLSGSGVQSWTELSTAIASWPRHLNFSGDLFASRVTKGRFYNGLPYAVPQNFQYPLELPKYDKTTFLLWIVVGAIVTAAVAVTAAVVAVKVSRAINAKRAANNARVEKAWEDYKSNPNADSWKSYRKVVRKNNIWTHFIGGTRYDYNNYWNGDVRDSGSAEESAGTSKFAALLGDDPVEENASTTQLYSLENVVTLIKG